MKNYHIKQIRKLQRIYFKNYYELRPIIVYKDYQGTNVAL